MLAWIGATALPVLVGLALVAKFGRLVNPRYLVAFSLGIFLWYFIDTVSGSADLDVNAGFGGGAAQVAQVVLFAAGLLVFLAVDRGVFGAMGEGAGSGFMIAAFAAIALGVHGLGEGTAYGATAASTSSTSLWGPQGAFGGISAGLSYVMHKVLEPMMVGSLYVAYTASRGRTPVGLARDVGVLALLFTLPSVIGAATGYFIEYDATYFFALGTGTSVYAVMRLAGPLFQPQTMGGQGETLKAGLALVFGFMLIYASALFHS